MLVPFFFCLLPTSKSDLISSLLPADPWILPPHFQLQPLSPQFPRYFTPPSPHPPTFVFQMLQKCFLSCGINFSETCFLTFLLTHFFLYFLLLLLFLLYHCKLALSLHLPHLKLSFTKYPHVSLGGLPSISCFLLLFSQGPEHWTSIVSGNPAHHHQPSYKTSELLIKAWLWMSGWAEWRSRKQTKHCCVWFLLALLFSLN